jgi:hypothetical protein
MGSRPRIPKAFLNSCTSHVALCGNFELRYLKAASG